MDASVNHLSHSQPTVVVQMSPEATQPKEKIKDSSVHFIKAAFQCLILYLKKFRGLSQARPNRIPWDEYLWSFIGAFLGIAAVAFLHYKLLAP